MIFRSGSGFFPGSSIFFSDMTFSGDFCSGELVEVSVEETVSSFPNFSFIATPPCVLFSCVESQGISTEI